MEKITFLVQGSMPEPYEVMFCLHGKSLSAYCTCPHGLVEKYCKHRMEILSGDIKKINLVSKNPKDIETIRSWLPGTIVEQVIQLLLQSQNIIDEESKRLAGYQQILARILRD